MTFTKEQWTTSGNVLLQNPNYIATRDSAKEAATADRESRNQHKLRTIKPLQDGHVGVLGISFPYDAVLHLQGVWFTTRVHGTMIILESGAKQ